MKMAVVKTRFLGVPILGLGASRLLKLCIVFALINFQRATKVEYWPEGTYGLPQAEHTSTNHNGCPHPDTCDFTWLDDGFVFFDTRDTNPQNDFSSPLNLFGLYGLNIEMHFCIKNTSSGCEGSRAWPEGCYCIFKVGACPAGFEEGSINWNGGDGGRVSGSLPSLEFNNGNIRLDFCCRCDGSISRPISLPSASDLFLMADSRAEGSCQKVIGTNVATQFVVWDPEGSAGANQMNPAYPSPLVNEGLVNITFCYYSPSSAVNSLTTSTSVTTTTDEPPNIGFIIPWIAVTVAIVVLLVLLVVLVSVILCVVKRRRGNNYVHLSGEQKSQPLLTSDAHGIQQTDVVATAHNQTHVTLHTTSALYASVEVNARARSENSGLQETQNQAFESHCYKNIPPIIAECRATPDSDDSFDSGESEQSFWMPPLDEKVLFDSLERMKYRTIKSADVKLLDFVGNGNFGSVYKAEWTTSTEGMVVVAAKRLNEGAVQVDKEKFLQEATIMGQFRHENIVKLYGTVQGEELCYIILEFMSNGNLRDYLLHLRKIVGGLPHVKVSLMFLRFTKEIACGMDFLSRKKFVHRDLAARNVLLNDSYTAKIGDFGFARNVEEEEVYTGSGGLVPLKWTAPEALVYRKYSTSSDVWSYGCVLYEIWSLGDKPMDSVPVMNVFTYLNKGNRQHPPPGCPRGVYKMMIDCWNPKSAERPKFNAILYLLQQPNDFLLAWTDADSSVHSQAQTLGADLEIGLLLYPDLQTTYT